ncbi:helix-turn-helix transcriptional regulator [Paenibacillus filicis]|uniref:Helix-turn-helix transcriptional regulator n=1 Tax=Paenibacillus gyeongsangnamensis TaxID=3388067 RepID=A0ABT4QBT0_9BACL|nr:helix-turn-helix transcriptional regulator [Paenibacillus filicis]MCZ8514343.1 helix-turn-helix transcriptional regulator [Paenibacillus filicis]
MSDNILKLVGIKIRELRKERGLSQEQLGEKAGFHFSYIGGIERAEKNISLLNLEKIAIALGVGVHELFSYSRNLKDISRTKETDIRDILDLMLQQEPKDIRRAKIILSEIFQKKV